MNNKPKKPNHKSYTAMTATDYGNMITTCLPGHNKSQICKILDITAATHARWTRYGITGNYNPTKADKNKAQVLNRVQSHANNLYNQSRSIESWLASQA